MLTNEDKYAKPSALPPAGTEIPVPKAKKNFSSVELDKLNSDPKSYEEAVQKALEDELIDENHLPGLLKPNWFTKAEDENGSHLLGKIGLEKPKGEVTAALEEESAAMIKFRLEALKKPVKKVELDKKALSLKQRAKNRRMHRLIFRKIYWKIIQGKLILFRTNFCNRIMQKFVRYQKMLTEKRFEKQHRPKVKSGPFISRNKRYGMSEHEIARKFYQNTKS